MSAIDVLMEMLSGQGDKPTQDDRVRRKPTNLPLTQMEPWADSIHKAMGARPSRTRYLPAAYGDEGDPLGLDRYLKSRGLNPDENGYALRGDSDSRTGEVRLRAGAKRDDLQSTYAHEVAHLAQDPDPISRRDPLLRDDGSVPFTLFGGDVRAPVYWGTPSGLNAEETSELAKQAWRKWSGRPVTLSDSRQTSGVRTPLPFDQSAVDRLAALFASSYNKRNK